MDLAKFDTEKFIALRGICPTPDDLPKLKSFDGGLDKLDEVSSSVCALFKLCALHELDTVKRTVACESLGPVP